MGAAATEAGMSLTNISPPTDLTPKAKYFDEVGDTCLNVDMCIEVCRRTDTPKAKAIYRAFRKRLATNQQGILSAEKHREQAFFDALHDLGFRTSFTPIKGTM
jgi:hypothetical protein